jgi:hypothetical protein
MISFIIPYLTEQWQMSPVAGGALESVVFLGMGVGYVLRKTNVIERIVEVLSQIDSEDE